MRPFSAREGALGAAAFLVVAVGGASMSTRTAAVKPALAVERPRKRLLVIGEQKGYRHEAVSHALSTIERLGDDSGLWQTVIQTDVEHVTKQKLEYNAKNLNDFDGLLFYTAGELELSEQQKADFLSFVHDDGKGFVGVHSAAITLTEWPAYVDMVGGTFDGHPWKTFRAPIVVEDRTFPGMDKFSPHFAIQDEIYQLKDFSRDHVRVLMRLDADQIDLTASGVNRTDRDFAVAWARDYGKGRVFFTTLGHVTENWDDPAFQNLMRESIKWSVGLSTADVTPRPAR